MLDPERGISGPSQKAPTSVDRQGSRCLRVAEIASHPACAEADHTSRSSRNPPILHMLSICAANARRPPGQSAGRGMLVARVAGFYCVSQPTVGLQNNADTDFWRRGTLFRTSARRLLHEHPIIFSLHLGVNRPQARGRKQLGNVEVERRASSRHMTSRMTGRSGCCADSRGTDASRSTGSPQSLVRSILAAPSSWSRAKQREEKYTASARQASRIPAIYPMREAISCSSGAWDSCP